jgi:hypothetical protein
MLRRNTGKDYSGRSRHAERSALGQESGTKKVSTMVNSISGFLAPQSGRAWRSGHSSGRQGKAKNDMHACCDPGPGATSFAVSSSRPSFAIAFDTFTYCEVRSGSAYVTRKHLSEAMQMYPDAANEIKTWGRHSRRCLLAQFYGCSAHVSRRRIESVYQRALPIDSTGESVLHRK